MSKLKAGVGALSGIKAMYDSHLDYKKEVLNYKSTVEVERTKRHLSDNRTKEYLADIKMKRDVILQALKNDYDLNQSKIEQSFKVIDAAIESGNIEMLGVGLTAMVKVAETSTIVSLADLSKKLEDKSSVIDI